MVRSDTKVLSEWSQRNALLIIHIWAYTVGGASESVTEQQ